MDTSSCPIRVLSGSLTRQDVDSARAKSLYQSWLTTEPETKVENNNRRSPHSREPKQPYRLSLIMAVDPKLQATRVVLEDIKVSYQPLNTVEQIRVDRGESLALDRDNSEPLVEGEASFSSLSSCIGRESSLPVPQTRASLLPTQPPSPPSLWRHPHPVPLTVEPSSTCHSVVIPLPSVSHTPPWQPDRPGQSCTGSATLHCNIILQNPTGGEIARESLMINFTTACLLSRHIFLTVGYTYSWGLDDSYEIFLSHLLQPIASQNPVDSCLLVYERVWVHGLLFGLIQKMKWACRRSFSSYECIQVIAMAANRLLRPLPGNDSCISLDASSILQMYSFMGQALRMFRTYPEGTDFPDMLWGSFNRGPVLANGAPKILRQWFELRNTSTGWSCGSQHILHFSKTALRALLDYDMRALVPTFRSCINVIPLLSYFGAIDVASKVNFPGVSVGLPDMANAIEDYKKTCDERQARVRWKGGSLALSDLKEEDHDKALRSLGQEIDHGRRKLGELERELNALSLPEQVRSCLGVDGLNEAMIAAYERFGAAMEHLDVLRRTKDTFANEESSVKRSGQLPPNVLEKLRRMEDALGERGDFVVETVAGSGNKGLVDGVGQDASFNLPSDMVFLPDGRLLVCDMLNSSLRLIDEDGGVTTLVGQAGCGDRDGEVSVAQLARPKSLCLLNDGSILIADTNNHKLKTLSADLSYVSTVVGQDANLNLPISVIYTRDGKVLLADKGNNCIREWIGPSAGKKGGGGGPGSCPVFAGGMRRKSAEPMDGHALKEAIFQEPISLTEGMDGAIYVCERARPTIRRIYGGWVSTIVMTPSSAAVFGGTQLGNVFPTSACAESPESLLLTDTLNSVLWRLNTDDGRLRPVVGVAGKGGKDGASEQAQLNGPVAIVKGSSEVWAVAEGFGARLRLLKHKRTIQTHVDEYCTTLAHLHEMEHQWTHSLQTSDSLFLDSVRALVDFRTSFINCKRRAQGLVFSKRAKGYASLQRMPYLLAPESTTVMVVNLPSLGSMVEMLGGRPWPDDVIALCHDGLVNRLKSIDWSSSRDGVETDLFALQQLLQRYGSHLINQNVMSKVIGDRTFDFPMSRPVLSLLSTYLCGLGWSTNRYETMDIRSALCRWLSCFFPAVDVLKEAFDLSLKRNLITWHDILQGFEADGLLEEPDMSRTIYWIIKSHLDSIVLRLLQFTTTALPNDKGEEKSQLFKVNCFRESLLMTRVVGALGLHKGILNTFKMVLVDTLLSVPPLDAFNDLITASAEERPPLSLVLDAGAALIHSHHDHILLQVYVVAEIAERLFAEVLKNSEEKKKGSNEEEDEQPLDPDKIQIKLPSVLRDSELWARMAYWYKAAQDKGFCPEDLPLPSQSQQAWVRITKILDKIRPVFQRMSEAIVEGVAPVDLVSRSLALHDALESMWLTLDSPLSQRATALAAMEKVNGLYLTLQEVREVVNDFMPDSEMALSSLTVETGWKELSTLKISWFLRQPIGEREPSFRLVTKVNQLPSMLVDALPWLHHLRGSRVFHLVWDEQVVIPPSKSVDDLVTLQGASRAWSALYKSIINGNVTFSRLRALAPLFIDHRMELMQMSRTALGFNEDGDKPQWSLLSGDQNWVHSTLTTLREWIHVSKVRDRLPQITECLQLLPSFLAPDAAPQIDTIAQHLATFRAQLAKYDWSQLQLHQLDLFAREANNIDPCLVELEPGLLRAITSCAELIDFLQGMVDDKDFLSSIEIALGKSEMECPAELWDEPPGRPGRVNEQKLSILRNVRAYLHEYLYRADRLYPSLEAFLVPAKAYGSSSEVDTITQNLFECNVLREPLMELLSSNLEQAAPNRLIQLQNPARMARWVVTNRQDGSLPLGRKSKSEASQTYHNLSLIYTVARGATQVVQRNNIDDLLDFQSAIVLAEARADKSASLEKSIDQFLRQFAFIRALSEAASRLHRTGHFSYLPTYCYSYPLQVDPEVIKMEAMRLQSHLKEWEDRVEAIRKEAYIFNFLTLHQVWRCINAMKESRSSGVEMDSTILQELLSCVSPAVCGSSQVVQAFQKALFAKVPPSIWGEESACDLLYKMALLLDEVIPLLMAPRERYISLPILAQHSTGADIQKPGIYVIVCRNGYQEIFDSALSCYVRAGVLPEIQDFLNCRADTRWEDVARVILNWEKGWRYELQSRLFCLCSVNKLGFDVQRRAAHVIRECLGAASFPLVLISESMENQHLITQYAHCRVAIDPLPLEVLQSVGDHVASLYGKGVTVHRSGHAGSGKSFNIRLRATQSREDYVHIPINHPVTASELISIIHNNQAYQGALARKSSATLHFDVSHTAIGEDLDALILDLVLLSSLRDPESGQWFFFNSTITTLSFELANMGPTFQYDRCRMLFLLPQVVASVSPSSFISSSELLRQGMGPEFASARSDGAALDPKQAANAFERLQYVCYALKLLKEEGGSFPYQYEGLPKDESIIPGDVCLDLLLEASALHQRPSLWCLWSWVNIMYWQLRDMHHPDSPINCACMPDPSATNVRDGLSKKKIKGEIIQFMMKTAREFATRQVRSVDPERVVAVQVSGFSRPEWNRTWFRLSFDNDGQPVFQNRMYYLYYRTYEDHWVIDTAVEPEGAVFSSNKNKDITSTWSTSPYWAPNPFITVTKARNVQAHNGESIIVNIAPSGIGGSLTANEAGEYLRQPPYDDIHGRPHYIKMAPTPRRHLFWNILEGCYQICPVCTDEEGAFAMSPKAGIEGRWISVPPDVVEFRSSFIFQKLRETQGYRVAGAAQAEEENEEARGGGRVLQKTSRQEAEEAMEAANLKQLQIEMLPWNDCNHECILFSNESHIVYFLSLDPRKLREEMHPGLLRHLEHNNIRVGETLDDLNSKSHQLLSSITGVIKTKQQADQLMGGKYCLTGDSVLKMVAIYVRLRCGIPCVLQGECGCGKTMSISYLCAWLGARLLVLDIHGGTSQTDIINIFHQAKAELASGAAKTVMVFLDEVNTCAHMGLIAEAICHSSINGEPLGDGIKVLAALNPYRLRAHREQSPGLVYRTNDGNKSDGGLHDPMSALVYRVHPIPDTLKDFIFDFGSLTKRQEKEYIRAMVTNTINDLADNIKEVITDLLSESQGYVRKVEGDPSSTSLRDVQRCLNLLKWFMSTLLQNKQGKGKLSLLARATGLALAHVYYYRLATNSEREGYEAFVVKKVVADNLRVCRFHQFDHLQFSGSFRNFIQRVHMNFARKLMVDDGIAMNQALMENLFVVIVCIFNTIPVFLVGKPGSSKTLTMQVIASNLLGKQSPVAFWRRFPAVYLVQYQCSPMSSAHSIQHQFDMAVSYQEQAHDVITTLLLDEVGLAEHSPDMPLKVLHGILVNPPIAIVGLSNWVLDASKMNRAICLQRPEPTEQDILLTGKHIVAGAGETAEEEEGGEEGADGPPQTRLPRKAVDVGEKLGPWLGALARAYHEIYATQKGRDFIGMRDYYCLLKLLRSQLSGGGELTRDLLRVSVSRNFGGKPEVLTQTLSAFHYECFGQKAIIPPSPVQDLIRANLSDQSSRHLMVLTRNGSALPVMLSCGLLSEVDTTVLIGSEFPEDMTELYQVQQVNQIKYAMASGARVVLLNHHNIYESLYDVLNQRYVVRNDPKTGKTVKMLRLAIGSRSQLCPVADSFKIIVVVEQRHAYEKLDLPLLNRFEKQILLPSDALTQEQTKIVEEVLAWCQEILEETSADSYQSVFCGYHEGTVPSLMLAQAIREPALDTGSLITAMKRSLVRMAFPSAVVRSDLLQEVPDEQYFDRHGSFSSAFDHYVLPAKTSIDQDPGNMVLLLTYSPMIHLDSALDTPAFLGSGKKVIAHPVAEFSSERQVKDCLSAFFRNDSSDAADVLVLQCDPVSCKQSIIDHVKYLCARQRALFKAECMSTNTATSRPERHIVVIIHMPPGIQDRVRHYSVDCYAPWTCAFVDDLRDETFKDEQALRGGQLSMKGDASLLELITTSAFELAQSGKLSVQYIITSTFQMALSRCILPSLSSAIEVAEESSTERLSLVRYLLASEPRFLALLEKCVMSILESKKYVDSHGSHFHVTLATTNVAVGTLRQSIQMALEMMVVRALVVVFRQLDNDYNLSILAPLLSSSATNHLIDLWFELTAIPTIFDMSALGGALAIAANNVEEQYEEVPSNGLHGPFIAHVPFSYKLVQIFQDPETERDFERQIIEQALSPSDVVARLESLCRGIFGDRILNLLNRVDYISDYVALMATPFTGLSLSDQMRIYRAIFNCTLPGYQYESLIWAHAAAYFNTNRIFHICALLSQPTMATTLSSRIIRSLERLSMEAKKRPISLDQVNAVVLSDLNNHLWDHLVSQPDPVLSPETLSEFAHMLADFLPDALALLADVFTADSEEASALWESMLGLQIMSIFCDEALQASHRTTTTSQVDQALASDYPRAWHLRNLRDLAQSSLKKSSSSFAKELFKTLPGCVDGPAHSFRITSGVFRRYVKEILFPQQSPTPILVEPNQRAFLSSMLKDVRNSSNPLMALIGSGSGGTHMMELLPLQRSILGSLVASQPTEWLEEVLVDPYTCQLYLQYLADVQQPADGEEQGLSPADCDLLLSYPAIPEVAMSKTVPRRSYLNALVKAQRALREYGMVVMKMLQEQPGTCEEGSSQVLRLLEARSLQWARMYLLRYLRCMGGINVLVSLIKATSAMKCFAWLKQELHTRYVSSTGKRDLSVLDPFEWFVNKPVYDNMCEQLRRFLAENITSVLDTAVKQRCLSAQEAKGLLAAATFSQALSDNNSIFRPLLGLITQYIRGSAWGTSNVSDAEGRFLDWLVRGCPRKPILSQETAADRIWGFPRRDFLQTQVAVHIGMVAMFHPNGWMASIMFNPRLGLRALLPTMPDDPFSALVAASGYVGWYKCRNGHPYTVGNCTWPMEETKCKHPGCSAIIGGTDHVPHSGNTRLTERDLQGDPVKGYDASFTGTEGAACYHVNTGQYTRGSPLSLRILRLFLHLGMHTSCVHGLPKLLGSVENLMFPDMRNPQSSYVAQELLSRIQKDWDELRRYTGLGDEDLTLALHKVIRLWKTERSLTATELPQTCRARGELEDSFNSKCVTPVFNAGLRDHLEQVRVELAGSATVDFVRHSLLPGRWDSLFELDQLPSDNPGQLIQALWRFASPVSLDNFQQTFNVVDKGRQSYPLLDALLQDGRRISLIKHMVDVLAWQAILFASLQKRSITRDEANSLTNATFVQQLPELQQPHAWDVLDSYCEAFNTILPLIPNLYECQENPYLDKDGRVDLSGTRTGGQIMSRDTPISFSLPSVIQGEADAPGLCTIQILNLLQTTQNEVLTHLTKLRDQILADRASKGIEEAKSCLARDDGLQPKEELTPASIPPISYLTPPTVLRRRLIIYDQATDLLPLATTFAQRNQGYGQGTLQGYHFSKIQQELMTLLSTTKPILLQITNFQYTGELRRTDRLQRLKDRVDQMDVPIVTLETIWKEIDTTNRLRHLMNHLELCIGFLVSVGGRAVRKIHGSTKLQDYVLDVLMVDPKMWAEVQSPTLTQSIRLCHLQCLFMYLEERMDGCPLDSVCMKYRQKLSSSMANELRYNASKMDLALLLPNLRELLTTQLTDPKWGSELSLKEYLGYQDFDLPYTEWFIEHFPHTLTLGQAFEVYILLNGARS